MPATYGRDVSQSEINAAQFQNYLRAPQAFQQAMRAVPHNSDAYYNLQNAVRSSEQDLAMAPTGVQIGTDGSRHPLAPPVASPERIAQGALSYLPPSTMRSSAMAPLMGPPAPSQAGPQRPEGAAGPGQAFRQSMAEPTVGARGVVGATVGMVNGRSMLVPEAGQYNNFVKNAPLGLNGTYGIDRGEFEGRRSELVRQQEAGRRGEKFEGRKLAGKTRAMQLEDEDRKNSQALALKLLDSGYTQKDLVGWHADQLKKWQEDQTKASEYDGLANSADNTGTVQLSNGNTTTAAQLRSQAAALRRARPSYGQSLELLGTPGSLAAEGSLPPEQQSFSGMVRGAVNNLLGQGAQQSKPAPQQAFKSRDQVLKTLTVDERQLLAKASKAQQSAFWQHYGL